MIYKKINFIYELIFKIFLKYINLKSILVIYERKRILLKFYVFKLLILEI